MTDQYRKQNRRDMEFAIRLQRERGISLGKALNESRRKHNMRDRKRKKWSEKSLEKAIDEYRYPG